MINTNLKSKLSKSNEKDIYTFKNNPKPTLLSQKTLSQQNQIINVLLESSFLLEFSTMESLYIVKWRTPYCPELSSRNPFSLIQTLKAILISQLKLVDEFYFIVFKKIYTSTQLQLGFPIKISSSIHL